MVHSKINDADSPPLGASIFSASGKNSGTVGTNGDIYISGASAGDRLMVKWGEDPSESCSLQVPELKPMGEKATGYQELSLVCVTP
nr:FimD/PapC C-terminal domain-containing protein [Pseudomonas sp. TMW22089]